LEYSVTQALAQLKLLDKRIIKEINQASFVSYKKGESGKIEKIYTEEEYSNNTKSSYAKITTLINRRNKIDVSIMVSNAITTVKINDKSMTVLEAISQKKIVDYKTKLLTAIKEEHAIIQDTIYQENHELDSRLQRLLETAFANKDKENKDDIKNISDPYWKVNERKLVDPLNIKKLIGILDEEIDSFNNQIDYILSESNAKTKILIEG
jgi:hypothetical protein